MTTRIISSSRSTPVVRRPSGGADLFPAHSPSEAINQIKKGLPFSCFKWIEHHIDLPEAQTAALLQIATRTLARRKKEGRLQLSESERAYRLGTLFTMAIDALGDEKTAQEWFKKTNRSLDGRTPLEYSDTEIGAREVEDLLGRIKHGVFG